MGSLIFLVKSLLVTVVVIMMLQIKVGEHTLEYRLDDMVRKSGIEQPAQYLADGIVKFVRNTWRGLTNNVNTEFGRALKSEEAPGSRHLKIDLDRSAEYLTEQAKKAKQSVENRLKSEKSIDAL